VELVLDKLSTNTVGFRALMQELGRNTTITNLAIRDCLLSRENNSNLVTSKYGSTISGSDVERTRERGSGRDFFENFTTIHQSRLNLSNNGLDDIRSANVLRELIRHQPDD
jgi:hypothetical protein